MLVVEAQGAKIPAIGLGTWQLRGETCARVVAEALQLGYRHIDTAQGYANEAEVGEGLLASGIAREEVFVTTKVRPQLTGEGALQESVEESLRKLGLDQVDLVLAHWPNPSIPVAETVGALSDAKRRGLTRHIGVSNYTVALLDEAVRASPEPIVTNQIEYHSFIDQSKILAAIRQHGLAITAYSPVARGRVSGDQTLEAIAEAHERTAAQVALRWLVQQGDVIVIPKSSRSARLKENLAISDFTLTGQEMARISKLAHRSGRLINDPSLVPRWD